MSLKQLILRIRNEEPLKTGNFILPCFFRITIKKFVRRHKKRRKILMGRIKRRVNENNFLHA